MKKVYMTSVLALCLVCPAFATDPTGIPADNNGHAYNDPTNNCIVDVLGVDSGSASLQADWDPNEITITWNGNNGTAAGGGTYAPANTTCSYDGDVTLPTPPTRLGYTFAGWEVDNSTNS